MKVLAISILVVLSLFTLYQGYTLVKKIQEKRKCKGAELSNSSSTNIDTENKNEEEAQ